MSQPMPPEPDPAPGHTETIFPVISIPAATLIIGEDVAPPAEQISAVAVRVEPPAATMFPPPEPAEAAASGPKFARAFPTPGFPTRNPEGQFTGRVPGLPFV